MEIPENKYIYFWQVSHGKNEVWSVINKRSKESLALIEWHSGWQQYVVCFEPNTIFNDSCLESIAQMIKNLNMAHESLGVRK